MTVCIATFTYYPVPGGIPNYCKHLAENLMATGHRVVILTIDHTNNLTDDELVKEKDYSRITLNRSYKKYRDHYARYFRPGGYAAYDWIAAGMAMKDWLLQNYSAFAIDIIETGDYGGLGIFLSDDRLPPLIVIGHSSIGQLGLYNYIPGDEHGHFLLEFEKLSFQQADGILAHSPMNQSALATHTGRQVLFARAPWTYPSQPPVVSNNKIKKNIVTGGLQMVKGVLLMMEATAMQAIKDPAFKLHWTGGDTHTAPSGQRVSSFLAGQHPGIWDINFIWQDSLPHEKALEEIAAADLVFIPSVWDTFNYTALEAAWFGKPLIMTETTGAGYLFTNDPGCKIISAAAEAIASAIPEQKELTEWSASIGTMGKKKLEDYFSPKSIIAERVTIYEKVVGQRQKHHSEAADSLRFLERYTNPARKFYYSLRAFAKRMVKPKL
ncbi:MAG TPA: glycosyltransferase family 4 protein [Chitinophagaceae bacterium]|nr:glycosyltransferase family 4 protein [Chitinophagaceae bacterium]